jgi:hypothetical protein
VSRGWIGVIRPKRARLIGAEAVGGRCVYVMEKPRRNMRNNLISLSSYDGSTDHVILHFSKRDLRIVRSWPKATPIKDIFDDKN